MAYFENNNGLGVGVTYGPYKDSPFAADTKKFGNKRQAVFVVDSNSPEAANDTGSVIPVVLPAGSYIDRTLVKVTEDMTATTSVTTDNSVALTDAFAGTESAGDWAVKDVSTAVTTDSQVIVDSAPGEGEGEAIVIIEYYEAG